MSLIAHLTEALEGRDPHLRGHCGRVTAFAEAVAVRLGWGEQRLAGEAIPVEGRLLAVADAFDAMISSRPYRPALGVRTALTEVERCTSSQFDPLVARAFLAAWQAGEIAVAERLEAAAAS